MGIFDIFRKKEKVVVKSVNKEELGSFLEGIQKEILEKENELAKKVFEKLLNLLDGLEKKKEILEHIDLKGKIADEKTRFIVRENLFIYKRHLERLIQDLNSLEISKNLIEKTNNLLTDFEKRSRMNYEKATYLIGKEIGDIEDSINLFYKDMKEVTRQNKEDLAYKEIIEDIAALFERINEVDEIKKELHLNIQKNKERINEIEKEIKSFEERITELKKSPEYTLFIEKRLNYDNKRTELKKETSELKNLIDLKKLSSLHHSDQKKMQIINRYKNDFSEALEKDSINSLIPLIEESGTNAIKIKESMDRIKVLNDELNLEEEKIDTSPHENIKEFEEEIKSSRININYLNLENNKEFKKMDKLEENKKDFYNEIKEELRKLEIDFII